MFEPEENPEPMYEDGGCDLMFIIGTALAVNPFNLSVNMTKRRTP